jgi:GH15 family glucan-1,4-alpha-glucosidase
VPSRIEDYALIGDCHTTALVARDGSIDWLCLPRFDSPACFAALLGTPQNGRWLLCPAGDVRQIRRRYREGTLILETEYKTDTGIVALIDFMAIRNDSPRLMRIVESRGGQVPMRMELTIRLDHGWVVPWVRRVEGGLCAIAGPDTLYCWTQVELRGQNQHTAAQFIVAEDQRVPFQLAWSPTYGQKAARVDPLQSLRETETWWREWSDQCSYRAEWREAVLRSLITLKALTHAPTGGILAAPTTSLPERLGGVRNWDYRYCWLRDATFTLYALLVGGYKEEARAWREWLVNAVAGDPAQMQIWYAVDGARRLTELEADWLPGYEGSAPVRLGNAAHKQHQLDVYGEIMDAMHQARRLGIEPDENAWRVQRELMDFLEGDWEKPDNGIWEMRGPPRQFTHSKVMAWVAMDRAIKATENFGLPGEPDRWRELRTRIHEQVCREGYNQKLNAFVQYYGSKEADASLLMLPLVGFLPPDDPRMVGTVDFIQNRLVQDGFVHRYRPDGATDGLPEGEGVFLLCTFWLADNLAMQGRHVQARETFERLLAIRNDVGLLSEEYDTQSRRLLGNFPQAFSHVGLINTARNLSQSGGPAEHRTEALAKGTGVSEL